MDYDDLLKDSRWRLKRRVILKRDNYTCTACGSKEKLCVHHTFYYQKPIKPWEYPDNSLITLCETCHNDWHTHNENTYKDNDNRIKKCKKKRIVKRKRKNKKGKRTYWAKRPKVCLAEIQAHREDFVMTEDGTWYRKGCVPKK